MTTYQANESVNKSERVFLSSFFLDVADTALSPTSYFLLQDVLNVSIPSYSKVVWDCDTDGFFAVAGAASAIVGKGAMVNSCDLHSCDSVDLDPFFEAVNLLSVAIPTAGIYFSSTTL